MIVKEEERKRAVLIDFGISRPLLGKDEYVKADMGGNVPFMSRRVRSGMRPTRFDDLEGLFHVALATASAIARNVAQLSYFGMQGPPWQRQGMLCPTDLKERFGLTDIKERDAKCIELFLRKTSDPQAARDPSGKKLYPEHNRERLFKSMDLTKDAQPDMYRALDQFANQVLEWDQQVEREPEAYPDYQKLRDIFKPQHTE